MGVREGWHNYALERYLGHSPKSITEKHYVLLRREEMDELLRKQVAERVNSALVLFLRDWKGKGKMKNAKVTQPEVTSSSD